MALNPATLATLIEAKMLLLPTGATPNPATTALAQAIAQAVVQHIQSAGLVTVVTTCPAGAGTGTGTVA